MPARSALDGRVLRLREVRSAREAATEEPSRATHVECGGCRSTRSIARQYQGQLAPVEELDGDNHVVSRFVYVTRVNVPDYMVKGGVIYRLITDHLGSVRLVVNTADG